MKKIYSIILFFTMMIIAETKIYINLKSFENDLSIFSSRFFIFNDLPSTYQKMLEDKDVSTLISFYTFTDEVATLFDSDFLLRKLKSNKEINLKIVCLSILFKKYDPICLNKISNFDLLSNKETVINDTLCARSVIYDDHEFIHYKDTPSLTYNVFRQLWLLPTGNTDFTKFCKERENIVNFATKYFLQYLNAKSANNSLPDRHKITKIREKLNSLNNEESFLLFAALSTNKIKLFKNNSINTGVIKNELQYNIKRILNNTDILISKAELLNLFGELSSEFRDKILISTESVVEDPDFMPTSKNQFYEAVIRFIYKYREIFWSEKEFEKLYERANPIAKYWIQEFRDNPSKAEF